MSDFRLELLHVTDQEASSAAVGDAPRLSAVLNALRAEDLGDDGLPDNTLTLSSGDAFIPSPFFSASEAVFGSEGIADIQIQNELGFQAIALGNHEFDLGTETLAGLISGDADGSILGADFAGAQFPYLSANLDFSTDGNLAPLEVAGGGAPQANTVTSSVVVDVNGEDIAVIGATTPTLAAISSPGDVTISPAPFDTTPTPAQLDALAAVIQDEVDTVLGANPAIDKVVLLAHQQQLSIELGLAERLSDVDIIVAGGSNTRLFDDDDRPRDGDSDQGQYPTFVINADGQSTAVVNTDGSYKYVGRLVIDFDDAGNIIPASYDETISGAFATDEQGVAELGAQGLIDPEIQVIADAIGAQIEATEGNVFGIAEVFLNGNRSGAAEDPADPDGVRTQETNLGNLTADANLAAAQESDPEVVTSIKNGGGIRASIGETVVPPGGTEFVRRPNEALVDSEGNLIKPEGGISQVDIEKTLAFNNGLTLVTLTRAELVDVLEHGVSALPGVAGQFPQVSGLEFSFDPDRPAGDRLVTADLVDADGNVVAPLVAGGELVGDPTETFRIVSLSFLVAPRFDENGNFTGGGDGYPFPNTNTDPSVGEVGDPSVIARANVVQLEQEGVQTGDATFADDGTEQDALAEFLDDNFSTQETAFSEADTGRAEDGRIVNLDFQGPVLASDLRARQVSVFEGEGGSDAAEVVAHEGGELFVTNGEQDRIDIFEITGAQLTATPVRTIPLDVLPGYGGVQSVAVKNGVVAVAIARDPVVNSVFGEEVALAQPGFVALFDAATGAQLATVDVGNLPDQLTFTPDGETVLVAGEGEKNEDSEQDDNPLGTVAIVDVADPTDPSVNLLDFTAFNGLEDLARAAGIRIQEGASFAEDVEPEYITVSPDGTTAFVALQENNAIATVDLASQTITDVFGLGTVDFESESRLDPLDNGNIDIRNVPGLVGLRMPDAIAAFETGGTTYVATANEGDSRDFDEARVDDLLEDGLLDPALVDELTAAGLLDGDPGSETGIRRLEVSTIDGDTDGDGDIDVLHAFSSRSFSIFDADGDLVFDSGPEFEEIIAEIAPERFNDDDGEDDENRSDAKGPEPEAIEIGEFDGEVFAFIGLERDSGVAIYNVTTPESAFFVNYIPPVFEDAAEPGEPARQAPEIVEFISAADSITGNPQIAVSYEVSGTTALFDLTSEPLINEVLASHTGTDDTEFVELIGTPGTSLDGLSFIVVESDDQASNGQIDSRFDFGPDDVFGFNGFHLLGVPFGLEANYDVVPDNIIAPNFIENSSATYALVETTSLSGDEVTGAEVVIDAVASTDGDPGDSFFFDAPVIGPDGDFLPAGVGRKVDGFDTDTAFDWELADFFLGPDNTPTAGGTGAVTPAVSIMDIQGAGHVSPFVLEPGQTAAEFFADIDGDPFTVDGDTVRTSGIVTAVDSNGFYLQDAAGDGLIETSDALFVFTGGSPGVDVGDELDIIGTVAEFFPGGAETRNLPTTQLADAFFEVVSTGNDLPEATIIGQGGRIPPSEIIDDDAFAAFEPDQDGIDFFESLEGMRVTAQDAVAVAPTNGFGEIFTVVDQGADATGISDRGTLNISPDDFNPEKVQIDVDADVFDFNTPDVDVDVGALLGDVTGVVSYAFGNFEIVPTEAFSEVDSGLAPETTALTPEADQLTVATYNVLNLDPNDADGDTDLADGRFDAIAAQIVGNLATPDIVALQEVQDNDGSVISGETEADVTLQTLVDAIVAAGGPEYEFIDTPTVPTTFIDADGETVRPVGGQPGGDIRNAFLYNPERVDLVAGSVRTLTDDEPDVFPFLEGRIPLQAAFEFNGEEVTLINNHFSSKGGSAPILGVEQPFDERQEDPTVNGSLDQRQDQAQAVADRVEEILAADPDAKVSVLGDLNEFEFVSPVGTTLADAGLTNLIEQLPEDDRYTFIFQGNSQTLDHVLASDGLIGEGAEIDIVHTNAEFASTDERASDHDPVLARFTIEEEPDAGELLVGDAGSNSLIGGQGGDTLLGEGGSDILIGAEGDDQLFGGESSDNLLGGAGDDLLNGGPGTDVLMGGDGDDLFVLANPDSFDYIIDFVAGEDLVLQGVAAREDLRVVDNGSGALLQFEAAPGDFDTLASLTGGAGLTLDDVIGPEPDTII